MSSNSPSLELDFMLQRLRLLRHALLRLHKALLDAERIVYEQIHGRIQSSGEFFRLVLEHEWFSWLRPISKFIVQIDEALSSKEQIEMETAIALFRKARELLRPSEDGTLQEQRYYQAIQNNPDIALMHSEVSQLLLKDI